MSWAIYFRQTADRTCIGDGRRFRQLTHPATKAIIPALMYATMRDSDVRGKPGVPGPENHIALHGMVGAVDDPIWDVWSPPGGYNCRCYLRPVSAAEMRALGKDPENIPQARAPQGAQFHAGFGGRSKGAYGG